MNLHGKLRTENWPAMANTGKVRTSRRLSRYDVHHAVRVCSMSSAPHDILWSPTLEQIERAGITHFARSAAARFQPVASIRTYSELHRWSIQEPALFWQHVWQFCGVIGEQGSVVVQPAARFSDWRFFPEATLNFAENLLQPQRLQDSQFAAAVAVVEVDELEQRRQLSRLQLWQEVCRFTQYLQSCGVTTGDRVAAVLPNRLEAVIAMLATAAIGAIWSGCSPDFGDDALYDRFSQIQPKLLIGAEQVRYNGRLHLLSDRLLRLSARLAGHPPLVRCNQQGWIDVPLLDHEPVVLQPLPFNHPLAILYSSGTTGAPKCMVHGAGGTLLQHLKEHQLHCDLQPGDSLLYYTNTGWMMWNWLVSALASSAAIVLFDGSPVTPDAMILWRVAEQTGTTHFGASARYYATLQQQNVTPASLARLGRLRCLLSTGSPLLDDQFRWLHQSVSSRAQIASISGGTDIVSCFVLGNPTVPVWSGEIQCAGLGMDVQVFNEQGQAVVEEPGELVCATPFPSMPIRFWNDPDGQKLQAAWFEKFPGVWAHGDWCQAQKSGGFIIFGRSDAVLNPSGVRIGTSEIYQQLQFFEGIQEALATALRAAGDEQIVLFLKMHEGVRLTRELVADIRRRLREKCSPRHVPSHIVQAPDLPRTISGKLSEIAARNALSGQTAGNAGALANPDCLEFFSNLRTSGFGTEWNSDRSGRG